MPIPQTAHVVAGALGLISGFMALWATKGGIVHRRCGRIFVYSVVAMTLTGSVLAIVRDAAPGANVPVGVLTAYLALTSLTTMRPPSIGARPLDMSMLLVAVTVSGTLLAFGISVLSSPTRTLYGISAYPFLIFSAIGTIATLGDLRLILLGGVGTVLGARRLARHLWRMCTALLISAFVFVVRQPNRIPGPIGIVPLLAILPPVVLVVMSYWLWRVRGRDIRTIPWVRLSHVFGSPS